jgi:hypothetical protein
LDQSFYRRLHVFITNTKVQIAGGGTESHAYTHAKQFFGKFIHRQRRFYASNTIKAFGDIGGEEESRRLCQELEIEEECGEVDSVCEVCQAMTLTEMAQAN